MHIYLKGTGALLFSGLISLILNCSSVYFVTLQKAGGTMFTKLNFLESPVIIMKNICVEGINHGLTHTPFM